MTGKISEDPVATGLVAAILPIVQGGLNKQASADLLMQGSTGATDNRILRSDGTGGHTTQSSAVSIDDSGNISGIGTLGASGNVTAGLGTGGTNNGQIRLAPSDSFPGFAMLANGVITTQLIATVATGTMVFDAPGGFLIRDTLNGGVTLLTAVTARLTAGVPVKLKSYTVATLPAGAAGDTAFATDGRAVVGSTGAANITVQGAGTGTGCLVVHNGTSWQIAGTATTVSA